MRRLKSFASIAGSLALTLSLAACSSNQDSGTAGETAPAEVAAQEMDTSVCEGLTLNFIGIAGEEGDKELASFRSDLEMKLQVSNNADWGQLIGAIKVGQEFDLSTLPNAEAQRMIASGVVQEIDTSKLTNWNDVVQGLRNSSIIRNADGKVFGVPIAWGDGPIVYSTKRVPTPPTSITELLTPAWKGRFTMFDDPALPFFMLAQSLGFTEVPLLTFDQLNQVKAKAKTLVKNASAFQTSYQDATDRMVAGDVDLTIGGWEAMTAWAEKKEVELGYSFLKEGKGGGWFDSIAIPSTAKYPECALAYINEMISPKTQGVVATNLMSGATNAKAVPLISAEANIYDYKLVESETPGIEFVSFTPPNSVPDGYATMDDWRKAWAQVKVG